MTVREAIEQSINTGFTEMLKDLDVCEVTKLVTSMGITKADRSQLDPNPSIALGSIPAPPLSMANAYAALASDGKYCKFVAVDQVSDAGGASVAIPSADRTQAMDQSAVNETAETLRATSESGGTVRDVVFGRPIVDKTGTTDEAENTWLVEFTPQLSTAVWIGGTIKSGRSPVGGTIGRVCFPRIYSNDLAVPMRHGYMSRTVANDPALPIPSHGWTTLSMGTTTAQNKIQLPTTPYPAGRAALSVIGTTAALGVVTLVYGLAEVGCPVLRRIDAPVLAADEEPFTVLHLANSHLTGHTEARVAWIRRLAQLQPDVVVNTGGDLFLAPGPEPLRRALEPLTGLLGALATGDHDYRSTVFRLPMHHSHRDPRKVASHVRDEDIEALPREEVRDLQAADGWVDLTDRRGSLAVCGRCIELVGADDPHANHDVLPVPEVANSVESAISLPAIRDHEGRTLRLGLIHAPYRRILEAMSVDDIDLALAGHTHDGQLCVPRVGALATNCDLNRGCVLGLSRWSSRLGGPRAANHVYLYIPAGLGTSFYMPVRLAYRSEAALLHLLPT